MTTVLTLPDIPVSPMYIDDIMSIEWQEFFRNLYTRVGEEVSDVPDIFTEVIGETYTTPINYAKRIDEIERRLQALTEPIDYKKIINSVELGLISLPTSPASIVMPGVSTDNAIVRWDGVTGRIIQNSLVIVSDTGGIIIPDGLTIGSVSAAAAILIEADGDLVLVNKLGIGVTPTYDIHIQHASSPTIFLQDTTNTCQAFLVAQNTTVRLGSVSNHAVYIQTNSTDRIGITNAGVTAIGDGGTANYTQFAATGLQTMVGDARVYRHIRVSGASWKPGVAAPTPGLLSTFPILIFGVNDEAHYSILAPFRMEAGSVINVAIDFTHQDAVDTGTAEWELEYRCVAVGEDLTGATATISGISGATAQHELTRVTLTTGIVGAVAHDDIGLIVRHTNGGTIGVNVDLVQVHFEFIMNKLGEPV